MAPILTLALLLTTPPAPVTPEFQEVARKSMTDYNLGYFDAALREAEEAYRLDQLPALLFNLGQCHRALGHWERAEFFYRSYLRNNPGARNRELVLGLIDKMVAKEKEAPAPVATPAPAAPEVVVVEAPTPVQAQAPPAAQAPPLPTAPTTATPVPAPSAAVGEVHLDEATAPSNRSHVWPWVLGAGAVLFTGAAVWGWYEAATFDSYKASAHTLPQLTSQQSLATAGEVTGIAGAVVAAALLSGAVLTW